VKSSPIGSGKIAFVTGAASGIGLAISTALIAAGNKVLMADVNQTAVAETAEGMGRNAVPVALDVTDAEQVGTVIDRASVDHGPLDLLVNNAGVGIAGEVQDLGLDHWNRILTVNLNGVVHCIHAVYPAMVKRESGHILNIASVAGLVPAALFAPYAASKAAVVGLSLSLRAEAATHGVGVTVVCPGVIETPLLDRRAPHGLAAVQSTPEVRAFLTRSLGSPYPAGALAADALKAVHRNQAMLISPRRARLAWRLNRLSPLITQQYAKWAVLREQRSGAP
jgi:NAD(P)-dependent dehydrogenase (short-subunit alcohol dehydrogenase family)